MYIISDNYCNIMSKQVKWDNIKKEFYVVEELENGFLIRPLTEEEIKEGGYN